ncbi:hypothetical protein CANMA_000700 [Candida margitis]|uniref:uncharacterized protein n=1 Tax=Candida margitis TaxID=1775924 RepID=UPI002225BDA8|nr:uncharacterized protein CANMA_000700 [Candida margitis]KAI5970248.1 hypothetical protein CANMA_000700 [Candida margitis]
MPKRKIPLEELDIDDNGYGNGAADNDYIDSPQPNPKRRQAQGRPSRNQNEQADVEYEDVNNHSNYNSRGNNNGALSLDREEDKAHDVNYVVKLILTKDARGQNFQKQHINQYLTNKRFKTDSLLDDAIAILENTYGLTLVDAPTVKQEKKFNATQTKQRPEAADDLNNANGEKPIKKNPPRNRFFVASNLSKQAQEVLGELWMKKVDSSLDKTKIGDAKFFIPKYKKGGLPKSNMELVKTGIMMLVTTLVILSENHIMESQLVRSLKKFGISDSVNIKNTNLNMNWEDILKELVSREYLNKEHLNTDSTNDKIFDISLGKRSLTELAPLRVYDYIKTLYGSDFNEVIAERAKVTIERAYQVSLKDEVEAEAVEADDSEETNRQEGETVPMVQS